MIKISWRLKLFYTLLTLILFYLAFTPQELPAKIPDSSELNQLWSKYVQEQTNLKPARKFPYKKCFQKTADKYNLPYSLLLAVARGESDFNPKAASDKDCYGIMQIRWPITARHLGIEKKSKLFQPCVSIMAGAKYLRELIDRYDGNVHLALAAYNYGPGRIKSEANPARIPKGAAWYSGYIHHHLQYVLKGAADSGEPIEELVPYEQEKKTRVIVFNQPYRAQGFYDYLQKKAPSVRLDWFRIGLGRFDVVLMHSSQQEYDKSKKRLKELGFGLE